MFIVRVQLKYRPLLSRADGDYGRRRLAEGSRRRAGTPPLRVAHPAHRRHARRFRLYDLRHTCATLLLSRNVHPKYVQELLGHASIALTLDTYSHIIEGMDGGTTDAIEEALG